MLKNYLGSFSAFLFETNFVLTSLNSPLNSTTRMNGSVVVQGIPYDVQGLLVGIDILAGSNGSEL